MPEHINITLEEVERLARYIDGAAEINVPIALQRDTVGELNVLNDPSGAIVSLSSEASLVGYLHRQRAAR